jgi:hypothetical protein
MEVLDEPKVGVTESVGTLDDSNGGGKPRNKRERSPSLVALNNPQNEKKIKPNTARKALDESEVDVTKSVVPLVNRTGSAEFGDLYQGEGDNVQYKFIRKSGSAPHIIYLAGQQDGRLYEYNTQAKKIKEHSSSKFHEMTSLTGDYVNTTKGILLGDSTPEKEMKLEKVDENGLNQISLSLSACAKKWVNSLKRDDGKTNLGVNSKYGIILKRSVLAILDKYGLEIDYAAAVQNNTRARDGLNNVELRHPTEKWDEDKNKDNRETAKLAALHFMSTDDNVKLVIGDVMKTYHGEYSISAVTEAYASAIADKGAETLIQGLAEARLRYWPITYGSKIYLAAKRNDLSETTEWEYFNTLIHEALHSVEHPNFTSFLKTHITPGLQTYIKEGIVDYLTNQIWIDVLSKLGSDTDGKKITPSHRDFSLPLRINKEAKGKYNKDYFEYKDQVKTVMDLIDNLTDGKKRLISAYFGGNLGAFLPKLKDAEEKKI